MKQQSNNVIPFKPLPKTIKPGPNFEEALEKLVEEQTGDTLEYEILYLDFPEPCNDNRPDVSLFEILLDEFIPETIEDYEKYFGDTFEDSDYVLSKNPVTGEWEYIYTR